MAQTKQDLITAQQKLSGCDFVRFVVCDMQGISRHRLVPMRNALDMFRAPALASCSGVLWCGPRSEADGFPPLAVKNGYPNIVSKPIPDAIFPVPWKNDPDEKIMQVMCEATWKDGSPMHVSPREVARKQIKQLDDRGLMIYSGFEIEFMLLNAETLKPVVSGMDYESTIVMSPYEKFFMEADKYMHQIGMNIEAFHVEYASAQFEAVFKPEYGLKAPEYTFMFKQGLKELAQMKGMQANFMSKPFADECGNGTHFNFSIWDKSGNNTFYDENGEDGLSDEARYWVGGLIKHYKAMCALSAPTVNCYRRFHKPWAPSLANWRIDDREVGLRVKNNGPSGTYMENRVPSGTCNHYLVLAATVAAGLDGLENKIEPPKQKDVNAVRLPDTLGEALDAFEADTVLRDALGAEFVKIYVNLKRRTDLEVLKNSDPMKTDVEAIKAEFEEYANLM